MAGELPLNVLAAIKCGPIPAMRDWRAAPPKNWTRAERNMAFCERYLRVPEGDLVGRPIRLAAFQEAFFYSVYDNEVLTRRAIASMARKNSKTATISMMVLIHTVGPEARQNSRIASGARSRKQAAEVYNYSAKMAALSPELRKVVRAVPSSKKLVGLPMNVEYEALSAEGATAHGGSFVVAILDEAGQVKGPSDDFFDAIITSQGAYEDAVLFVISTQAPTDADFMSIIIDDAVASKDPATVCHVYAADPECDLLDESAWEAANPALGLFRSRRDLAEEMKQAARMPAAEARARQLFLNQRIDASSPFISRGVWASCGGRPDPIGDRPVFAGLDLSSVSDLTAFVAISPRGSTWDVHPTFWLPEKGLREKAKADRVPYDLWQRQGFLATTPGASIDYHFVAAFLRSFCERYDVRKIAFDRWGWRHLKPLLANAGFTEDQLEGDLAIFEPFGQGMQSMSPALLTLESRLLKGEIAHGEHPVLETCAKNATVKADPSGNRKLDKANSRGRIDGMVALAMATAVSATWEAQPELDVSAMLLWGA